MSARLRTIAREIPAQIADAAILPDAERAKALRRLVRRVHYAVMRETVHSDAPPADELHALADAVRTLPEPVVDELAPRERIFLRLLRRDAVEPAWTLAGDNASGVVARSTGAVAMWAGPTLARTQLALPTFVERDEVYAWLPGFRDPRWGVPDEVFDLGQDVTLAARLDRAGFAGERLHLSGTAWLTGLEAGAGDTVELVLSDGAGNRTRVHATRTRTPEHVEDAGPDLTRLAWAGWCAEIDLAAVAERAANWRIRLEVAQLGVRRGGRLGLERGPLARPRLLAEPYEARTCAARIRYGGRGGLVLQVRPSGTATGRALPVGVRAALRRVRPRAVPPPEW